MTTPTQALPRSGGRFRRLLRMPLLQKLIVADLIINAPAFAAVSFPLPQQACIMTATLVFTLLLNAGLVYWTLLPLRALELTAAHVAKGDLTARVPISDWTDRNVARIAFTLNALLDRLLSDQARVRHLSAQAIGAADAERAHLARELHDSTAQSLSAVDMLLTATWHETPAHPANTLLRDRLCVMQDVVRDALHEVRTLSHNVHPSALDHLGLAVALEVLVGRLLKPIGIHGTVEAHLKAPLSPPLASVLYRVAQEALGNAMRHGKPRSVSLLLVADAYSARLSIRDDGCGFDLASVESTRHGMGLFMMRERLMLVQGTLVVESDIGLGTLVRAIAPNPQEAA
ncbi:MAG: sensor histidine kinase [Rubrivivax sp.]|nr:MAG: sensor histidine kinase [Rubrivivax sp.]